jgi:SAM-dependent MidA family methyltransferase
MAPAEPSTGDPARLGRLHEALRASAGSDGFLAFDRFAEIALHRAGDGYYATRTGLGAAGDFYTAAHVHPVFGRTVGHRILEEFERLGHPDRFRVVEVGPGDGTMAREVLEYLRRRMPPGTTLSYVLVEASAALRATAAERLQGLGDVRIAESLGADGPFEGVILANELLDALPFRRVVRRGAGWNELGVRWGPGRWEWAEGPPALVPAPELPSTAPEGTVLEVSPTAEAFVREIADHLEAGVALLLDYGASEGELVAGHPTGTLAAVRAHRSVDDPLEQPGSADLSAYVNFSRIRAAAVRSGLAEVAYGPQREALVRWGIEGSIQEAVAAGPTGEAEVRTRLAVKNLLFGFENFQILELRPGPVA